MKRKSLSFDPWGDGDYKDGGRPDKPGQDVGSGGTAMARRLAIGGLVVVVLAGVGLAGLWFFAAQSLRNGLDAWAAQQRADGREPQWAGLDVAGFPWRLDAMMAGPRYAAPDGDRAWAWAGPDISMTATVLEPQRVDLAAPGRHTVSLGAAEAAQQVTVDAARLDGRIAFDGAWRGRLARAAATELTARLDGPPLDLRARRVELLAERPTGDDAGNATLAVVAQVDDLVLPDAVDVFLGPEVERALLSARLIGRLPPGPLPGALHTWRQDGGIVEVPRLELRWGGLRIVADGTVALDALLQPEAAFTARISGLIEVFDALEAADLISGRNAAAARIVVAAMTRASKDGGEPEVELPVTVQEQMLSLGPLKVMRLPPVRWEGLVLPVLGLRGAEGAGLAGLDDTAADRPGAGEPGLERLALAPAHGAL